MNHLRQDAAAFGRWAWRAGFGLLAGLALLACGQAPPSSATQGGPTVATSATAGVDEAGTTAAQAPAETDPMARPVARWTSGTLTMQDLLNYGRDAQISWISNLNPNPRLAREQILAMDDDRLTSAAEWIVSRLMAFGELQSPEGTVLRRTIEASFNKEFLKQTIVNRVYDLEVTRKIVDPSEADIEAYYDQHRAEFFSPFSFKMRHLILTTYDPYVVTDSDAAGGQDKESGRQMLRSIAERVNGDASTWDQIRADIEQRPLRWEPDKNFKPLVPGERLLVPMDETQAERVHQQLNQILRELDQGTSFTELCRRYSQPNGSGEVIGPLPSGTRERLPQFLTAAKATTVGAVSEPFRTPHGWQAIQVVSKQEERYLPLQEVRPQIIDAMTLESRDALNQQFAQRLFSNPNLEIDFDKIAQGNALTTDTVVATVGDQQLQWGKIEFLWERYNQPRTRGEILNAIQRSIDLQQMLLLDVADQMMADPNSEISRAVERTREATLGDAYLNAKAILDAKALVTPERVRQTYQKYLDEAFRAVPQVTFVSIERRLADVPGETDEARKQRLLELYQQTLADLATIKTIDDFRAAAERVDAPLADADPPPLRSLEPVPVTDLDPQVRSVVEALEPGQWSQPIAVGGNRVVSIALLTKKQEGYRPFEEAETDARNITLQEIYRELQRGMIDKYLADAHFESLL